MLLHEDSSTLAFSGTEVVFSPGNHSVQLDGGEKLPEKVRMHNARKASVTGRIPRETTSFVMEASGRRIPFRIANIKESPPVKAGATVTMVTTDLRYNSVTVTDRNL
ncbi:unnamed protein product [Protopolystoma xenopodis]|uniref:Uncharacterized protein n=1 Tax=Protopolystoma xenopodis TaxID=117903 RepID=A0A3S5AJD8_9PLAT|nr:unnamed protein product [Protopolystoma xenopodis]